MNAINLRRENGKRVTVQGRGAINNPSLQCVQVILWRKNNSPLQTLEMTLDEAEQLGTAIFAAIYDAKAISTTAQKAGNVAPQAPQRAPQEAQPIHAADIDEGHSMSADMPKPFGYWHEGQTYEESDFFLASEFGNVGCDRCTGLYTAEDLEKAKQEAARQAIERAIRACLDLQAPDFSGLHPAQAKGETHRFDMTTVSCANAIRALIHQSEERHG